MPVSRRAIPMTIEKSATRSAKKDVFSAVPARSRSPRCCAPRSRAACPSPGPCRPWPRRRSRLPSAVEVAAHLRVGLPAGRLERVDAHVVGEALAFGAAVDLLARHGRRRATSTFLSPLGLLDRLRGQVRRHVGRAADLLARDRVAHLAAPLTRPRASDAERDQDAAAAKPPTRKSRSEGMCASLLSLGTAVRHDGADPRRGPPWRPTDRVRVPRSPSLVSRRRSTRCGALRLHGRRRAAR